MLGKQKQHKTTPSSELLIPEPCSKGEGSGDRDDREGAGVTQAHENEPVLLLQQADA